MRFVPRPSRTDDGRGCRLCNTSRALVSTSDLCRRTQSSRWSNRDPAATSQQDQSETLGSDVLLESVSEPSLPGAAR